MSESGLGISVAATRQKAAGFLKMFWRLPGSRHGERTRLHCLGQCDGGVRGMQRGQIGASGRRADCAMKTRIGRFYHGHISDILKHVVEQVLFLDAFIGVEPRCTIENPRQVIEKQSNAIWVFHHSSWAAGPFGTGWKATSGAECR